jgi:hypothetical protein
MGNRQALLLRSLKRAKTERWQPTPPTSLPSLSHTLSLSLASLPPQLKQQLKHQQQQRPPGQPEEAEEDLRLSSSPQNPPPPEPVDCSSVCSLVHSLCQLGHRDPAIFDSAAELLLPNIDVLSLEELIALSWDYSVTLHQHDHLHASPSMSSSSSSSSSSFPSSSSPSSPASPPSSSATAAVGGPGPAHLELLTALSLMLEAALPSGRPDSLTGPELRLLWQAQACSLQWAAMRGGGSEDDGLTAAEGEAGDGDERMSRFRLHPRLRAAGESCIATQKHSHV